MTIFLVTNETHGFTQCLHDLAILPTLRYTPGNCRMFLSCACWDRENTGHSCWQETTCLQSFPTSVNLFMFFSFLFFIYVDDIRVLLAFSSFSLELFLFLFFSYSLYFSMYVLLYLDRYSYISGAFNSGFHGDTTTREEKTNRKKRLTGVEWHKREKDGSAQSCSKFVLEKKESSAGSNSIAWTIRSR